jgi:hypothetical protein
MGYEPIAIPLCYLADTDSEILWYVNLRTYIALLTPGATMSTMIRVMLNIMIEEYDTCVLLIICIPAWQSGLPVLIIPCRYPQTPSGTQKLL